MEEKNMLINLVLEGLTKQSFHSFMNQLFTIYIGFNMLRKQLVSSIADCCSTMVAPVLGIINES